jgi:hypothetical protein
MNYKLYLLAFYIKEAAYRQKDSKELIRKFILGIESIRREEL